MRKSPDFSIGATQKSPLSELKFTIFPPDIRNRRTCTPTYKWVDALKIGAGMPKNQVKYSTNLEKSKFLRQLFHSYLCRVPPRHGDFYFSIPNTFSSGLPSLAGGLGFSFMRQKQQIVNILFQQGNT